MPTTTIPRRYDLDTQRLITLGVLLSQMHLYIPRVSVERWDEVVAFYAGRRVDVLQNFAAELAAYCPAQSSLGRNHLRRHLERSGGPWAFLWTVGLYGPFLRWKGARNRNRHTIPVRREDIAFLAALVRDAVPLVSNPEAELRDRISVREDLWLGCGLLIHTLGMVEAFVLARSVAHPCLPVTAGGVPLSRILPEFEW